MKHTIIFGAGGHGKVIADIVEKSGDRVFCFLDEEKSLWGRPFFGIPVRGGLKYLLTGLVKEETQFELIVAIGDNRVRKQVVETLETVNITFATAIHPSAVITRDVTVGEGTVIMANCVINPGSVIGKHCIINTGTTVDHDCRIGDFVHLSPGVNLGGTVRIGAMSWCGVGSSVINNIDIGQNAVVGAGSVVIRKVEPNTVVVGNPAALLRKNEKMP